MANAQQSQPGDTPAFDEEGSGDILYGGGSNDSSDNVLIVSLYLIDSEDDILHNTNNSNVNDVKKRARLYQRLCQACKIANNILTSSSYPSSSNNKDDVNNNNYNNNYHPWSSGGDGPIFGIHCNSTSNDDIYNNNGMNNNMDGDDLWQSQSPTNHHHDEHQQHEQQHAAREENVSTNTLEMSYDDALEQQSQQQPHLRAKYNYNNDINDLWRCISLVLQISRTLSSSSSNSEQHTDDDKQMKCAIEIWDNNDGHILLIEAANYLPNWVDNDIQLGGVGGPSGCNNRCWVVNGKVCLISPSFQSNTYFKNNKNDDDDESVDDDRLLLSREDALSILMKEESSDLLVASEDVQCAIRDRINRTDYSTCVRRNGSSIPQQPKKDSSKKQQSPTPSPQHWHIAAVALPASVARFIEMHPSLVPLLIDSFCKVAPDYLKEQHESHNHQSEKTANGDANNNMQSTTTNNTQHDSTATRTKSNTTSSSLGASFPYEQIVTLPITFTRTSYAELVTGRGIVPTFPVPKSYKSVELNRFQRQLRQSTANHWAVDYEDDAYGGGIASNKRRRNRFSRAVDVGVRLCAGLDWIVSNNNHDGMKTKKVESMNHGSASSLEDSAIEALGEVERKLRIYWARIDAEASASSRESSEHHHHDAESESSSLPWIEQAWQAGPNGLLQSTAECSDKSLIQALESMSKCHVFNPELSRPLWETPCPYTRPNVTLINMVQSGIKSALKWQREKYEEDSFPMPREWEVDDDSWMDVNSLEELEEEMKNLSTRQKMNSAASGTNDSEKAESGKKPRRTTRRSRRKLAQSSCCETEDGNNDTQQHGKAQPIGNVQQQSSLNKGQGGFQLLVDDKDDLVTKNNTEQKPLESFSYTQDDTNKTKLEPEHLMSQAVNINPTKFLNILHARLKKQSNSNQVALGDEKEESLAAVDDQDISKFFFDEDLDNDDISDDSKSSNDGDMFDDYDDPRLQQNGSDEGEDPWSLHNIMEAMDHELRTDDISHPSIKNLSVASENNDDNGHDLGTEDSDLAILSNLLSSIDTQGDGPSPVSNILREMGICSSHLPE